MFIRTMLCAACLSLAAATPVHSQADALETGSSQQKLRPSLRGALQLASGITLMRYSTTSLTPSGSPPPPTAGGMPRPGVVTTCCISKTPFFLEGGLGLTEHMLVGGVLQFYSGSEAVNDATPDARELMWSVSPKLDYHLLPSSRFNPFIGFTAGISHITRSYYDTKDTRLSYGFYGRVGTRVFVLEELSIDSALSIGGYFGSGSQTGDVTVGAKREYDLTGFDVALALEISLWLN